MANVFLDLPLPAGNGGGAPVDVSSLGREKTVTIQGSFTDPKTGAGPAISVQVSVDGGATWAGLKTFSAAGKKTFNVAAQFMRTFVQDFNPLIPLAANVDVAADDIGALFAGLPVTPAAGTGLPVNVSLLGTFKTVIVEGDFSGSVHIDISEDGIDWTECFTFTRPGALKSKKLTAQFMRTRRTLVSPQVPGSATAAVGGINDATAGGGAAGGPHPILMYQPGGGGVGPQIFGDWIALFAQVGVIRAAAVGNINIKIAIDDSIVSPAVIPAGTFPMQNIQLAPAEIVPGNDLIFCEVAEDCFLPNLTHVGDGGGNLIFRNAPNSATTPITFPGAASVEFINEGAFIDSTPVGTAPMITMLGMAPGAFAIVACTDFGSFGQNPFPVGNPVWDVPTDGHTLFINATNGGLFRGSVSGSAGAVLIEQGGTGLWFSGPQPNFLGTQLLFSANAALGPAQDVQPAGGFGAAFVASTTVNMRKGVYYFDASGGPIAQTLPTIGLLNLARSQGVPITFVETSGTAGLSIVAAAGQTLNGVVAGSFAVPPGGAILVLNDGTDAWSVTSIFDPATVASDQTTLVYRVNGPVNGPIIFNVWDDLYNQLLLIRAAAGGPTPVTIEVDFQDNLFPAFSTVSGALSPYDFIAVRLTSTKGTIAELEFADGIHAINLREFDSIGVYNSNQLASGPLEALVDGASGFPLVALKNNSSIQSINGGAAFFDASALTGGMRIEIQQFSNLAFDIPAHGYKTGPIIVDFPVGTFFQLIGFDLNPFQRPFGDGSRPLLFTGDVGSAMIVVSESTFPIPSFPGFLGAIIDPVPTQPAFTRPNPYQLPAAVAAVSATFGQELRLDVSGGPVAQPLPAISTALLPFPGGFLTVIETSGTAGLTLTPAGGDTIRGSAAAFPVPGGGGVLLQGDGVDNWDVIALYDPADVGADNQLVYQPFTPAAGPVAFDSWPALMAQLTLMKAANNGTGQYLISFRDAGAAAFTPMIIPAGGPYDMVGVTWSGLLSPGGANTHIADGASFVGLRQFQDGMFVRNLNTVTPADDSLDDVQLIEIRRSCDIAGNPGGAPMWGNGSMAIGSFIIVRLETNSNLGNNSAGPIFDFLDGRTLLITADNTEPLEPTRSDLLVGTAGAVLLQRFPGGHNVKKSNPLWLGTNLHFYFQPASLQPNPYRLAAAVAAVTSGFGNAIRLDASGGPIVQPLVSISGSNTGSPGGQLSVVETSGTAGVTVTPGAGDTIRGSAAPLVVPPGGGVLLQSDGVSNWDVVATHNPADDASSSNALIYRPGSGLTGPVIFDVWGDLMNQLTLMRAVSNGGGKYTIQNDDSIVSPAIIPVAAPVAGAPTAAFTGPVGATMTLTDGGASFTFSPDGRFVTIAGATSPANDGVFPVTAVPTPTTVEYTNAAGVAEAAGAATYSITTPWDLTNVELAAWAQQLVITHFADGITFLGLRHLSGQFISVLSTSPSPPPSTDFASPANDLANILVEGGCQINAENGVPLWDTSQGPAGLFMFFQCRNRGVIANNPGQVFHAGVSGQFIIFFCEEQSGIWRVGISSVVGVAAFAALSNQCIFGTQLAWLGTLDEVVTISGPVGNVGPVPPLAANIAPVALGFSATVTRCDVSGGGFTQVLPNLPLQFAAKGTAVRIMIKEESGTDGLLVDAAGADTIEGSGLPVAIPAGGSITFIADGVSNWYIEAISNPAQGPGAVYVYQPGGTGIGPVVFSDWKTLEAAKEANRVAAGGNGNYPIEVRIDDSIVTPAVIPANGADPAYNLTDVVLTGRSQLGVGGASTRLDFADDTSVVGMRAFRDNLGVVSLNTTTVLDDSGVGSFTIKLDNNCFVNTPIATGVPVWGNTGTVAGDFIILTLGKSSFINFNFGGGLSNGPVLDMPTAGTFLAIVSREGAAVPFLGITGIVGVSAFIFGASTRDIPNVLTGFLGTIVLPAAPDIPASLAPNPYYISAPLVAAFAGTPRPGAWIRFDVSGGPIVQPVPGIAGFANNYKQPGVFFVVTEESGNTGLTIVPGAGDTLNGSAAAIACPPGGALMVVNNGISDSRVIGIFDPKAGCANITGPFTFPAGGAVAVNDLAMVDVSGGVVPMTLPAITASNKGCKLIVKKIAGGGAAFTLTPAGADTIDGAAGASAFGGALISVTLRSDGVSNWMVV